MPYKDRERRNEYQRGQMRRRRKTSPPLPALEHRDVIPYDKREDALGEASPKLDGNNILDYAATGNNRLEELAFLEFRGMKGVERRRRRDLHNVYALKSQQVVEYLQRLWQGGKTIQTSVGRDGKAVYRMVDAPPHAVIPGRTGAMGVRAIDLLKEDGVSVT
jgi:thiamine pyrophosphate-dependent acetolactate synthase large subunit-like protein